MPILSLITFLPLVPVLAIIFLVPRGRDRLVAQVATWSALAIFVVSLGPLLAYDRADGGFQFVEAYPWIPSLGVQYKLGVDGVSLLLIVLTTLLGFIACLSSWSSVQTRVKEYYVSFLLLQVGMVGTFAALDTFLFYIFWEAMLVPMYFIIGIWGGARKLYAALKFFLFTLAGSVFMLLGLIALYFLAGDVLGTRTFDVEALHTLGSHTATWTAGGWDLGFWVFLALFLGFAIKVPMFPFHTWLPDAHVEAPTAGSVILAGVLLKMGTYGFYRFSLPIFPAQTVENLPWLLGLCVIGIVYGAMVALVQKDWKKLVAYSSVSHLGVTMIGLFALNTIGIKGSVVQMINHGISTGALFLLVGFVYERRHTRLISEYGGLARVMPLFATLFFFMLLSSVGLPGLNGFIGEVIILIGLAQAGGEAFSFLGYSPFWWVVLTATALVLGACYLLWLWQKTMFGRVTNPENEGLADLNARETWTLLPLAALALAIGLYPAPLLRVLDAPVERLVVEQMAPALREAGVDTIDLPAASVGVARRDAPTDAGAEPLAEDRQERRASFSAQPAALARPVAVPAPPRTD